MSIIPTHYLLGASSQH